MANSATKPEGFALMIDVVAVLLNKHGKAIRRQRVYCPMDELYRCHISWNCPNVHTVLIFNRHSRNPKSAYLLTWLCHTDPTQDLPRRFAWAFNQLEEKRSLRGHVFMYSDRGYIDLTKFTPSQYVMKGVGPYGNVFSYCWSYPGNRRFLSRPRLRVLWHGEPRVPSTVTRRRRHGQARGHYTKSKGVNR